MLHPYAARVRYSENGHQSGEVMAMNSAGLSLRLDHSIPYAKHIWVRFGLPDHQGDCLVLAEIIERDDALIRARFKHVFPDHALALEAVLSPKEDLQAQVA